jgi:hypothetical protein
LIWQHPLAHARCCISVNTNKLTWPDRFENQFEVGLDLSDYLFDYSEVVINRFEAVINRFEAVIHSVVGPSDLRPDRLKMRVEAPVHFLQTFVYLVCVEPGCPEDREHQADEGKNKLSGGHSFLSFR